MKKKLFILSVILLWAIVLVGASINLNSLGISVQGNGYPRQGSTIIITMNYLVAGIPEGGSMDIYGMATGAIDQAQIKWYPNADGTGTATNQNVAVNQIANTIYYNSVGNGYTASHTATFTLPAPPSGKKSFKVYGRVYGATSDNEFTYIYSGSNTSDYLVLNSPPVASDVIIVDPTLARVGQTLTGQFNYSDPDGNDPGTHTYRWLSCSTENGTYTAIFGATTSTYTVQSTDANKYIKFEVTPVASEGQSPGLPVLSAATPKVTGAPIVEIDNNTINITESSANNGTLGSAYVKITCTNTSFKSSITDTDLTLLGDLDGLSKGSVTWISANEIRLGFTGTAEHHEYAAKIENIAITVNKDKLEGVENNLTTGNSFNINFTNNPPSDLLIADVGNSYVKITWNNPAGLLPTGTGLRYFNILRDEQHIYTYNLSKGTYYFTDTNVTNGTLYHYKVQAVYVEDGNPISAELKATPLAITAFYFNTPPVTGTIDHTNKSIKVVVPNQTDRTALKAYFTAPGTTVIVKVEDTTQESGTTVNNFTNSVIYKLTTTNINDASTCSYEVAVKEKLATPSPSTIESNTTTSSFKIQWGSVSGAESYLLDVSTDGGFSSFLNGYHNKSLTTTSCTVNGLSANTTYYYRVKAVDSSDPDLNSDYSNTIYVTTLNIPDGKGSTEINSDEPTTIDVSSYVTPLGTVIPKVIVDPIDFTSTGNDIITVSMSYGIHPEGLQYNLAFNNRSIGIGTYVLYYTGLLYDPTDVRYRLNGGELQTVTFIVNPVTESGDKSITVTINNLPELSKATYNLQIVLNDDSGQTLPVVLSSFTATLMVQGKVRLEWVTQSASGLSGFRVLRNTVDEISTAVVVSSLIEANNTSTAVTYPFIDNEIPCNGTYYYWLQIEGQDGSVSYYGSIAVEVTNGNNPDIPIPQITALNNPFPNPFNPSLTIPFDLSKDGRVTIKIYNLKGQLIKNLLNENKKAANYYIVWDGKDNNGHIVSAGTYIVRMNAPEYNSSRKIVMVK